MGQIFWMVVPYVFICLVLAVTAYVITEVFDDHHRHQH